jgi:hypothetical protein
VVLLYPWTHSPHSHLSGTLVLDADWVSRVPPAFTKSQQVSERSNWVLGLGSKDDRGLSGLVGRDITQDPLEVASGFEDREDLRIGLGRPPSALSAK